MLLAFVALLAPPVFAQGGEVEGSVVNIVTRQGIAGAAVKVGHLGDVNGTEIQTDGAGNFRMSGLARGRYYAEFSHDGFADPQSDYAAQKLFAIGADGDAVHLLVELTPRTTLRGKLLDPEGRPKPGVGVDLIRLRYPGSYTATTDAHGEFVFDAVRPTAYVVVARASSGPTWYPGVTDREQAAAIVIPAGAELSGYEFRLRTAPAYRVRGVVTDEGGKPLGGAAVRLEAADSGDVEASTTTRDNGKFEFPRVRPGRWRSVAEFVPKEPPAAAAAPMPASAAGAEYLDYQAFIAFIPPGERAHKGFAEVEVAQRDVEQVAIRVLTPFSIRASVLREDPVRSEVVPTRGSVRLAPVDGVSEGALGRANSADGNLEIARVFPGRYRIEAGTPWASYYLASAAVGDRDVTDQEVELGPGAPPIRVIFRPGGGSVSGTVEKGEHATVILLRQGGGRAKIEEVPCQPDGGFQTGELAPGDYWAWAFEFLDAEALRDPGFARTLAPRALPVHVSRGERVSVTLRVTPWPE